MTINIRIAHADDAMGILSIYAPYCEASSVTFETVAPTREEMAGRISRITEDYPWLVAEDAGRVLGYVYATRFRERAAYRWTAEVAVYVARGEQRRGIGRVLYSALFSILKAQGFSKAVAGITLPNPASAGLHEKLGFRSIGSFSGVGFKDGAWLDVGWWQLALRPEVADPREPEPFSTLRNSVAVHETLAEACRAANKIFSP